VFSFALPKSQVLPKKLRTDSLGFVIQQYWRVHQQLMDDCNS
jgi:hypothetical protein